MDRFAEDFEWQALAHPGRSDYRVLVSIGTLVATSVVIGQLIGEDTIVLMGIEVELTLPDHLDES